MLKSIQTLLKQDKEMFVVPRRVQDLIPVQRIWPDGIFQVGPNKFSKTWKFSDINYQVASEEDKENMFLLYSDVLNSFDSAATTKITVNNHRLNKKDFENSILMQLKGDKLDVYREEYNNMLLEKATGANGITQEKYITVSINKKSVEDARTYFARTGADLQMRLSSLGSSLEDLDATEKLRILHDFFRPGYEQYFDYDDYRYMHSAKDFQNLICPDGITFRRNHFEFGNKFGRALFLRTYASFLTDDLISDITEYARDLILSIDLIPVPTDEAVKEVESIILGVETDITRWQQRQNSRNNFTAEVPRTMEQKRDNSREYMDDLTMNDQRMIFSLITLVHTADSLEQLDADTESLIAIGKEHLCDISSARFQQEDGLNTALPYGLRRIHALHTLTTESCAVAIPFRAQEIQDPGGLSYGINEVSKNPLICDRKRLVSPHAFYLGVSGSGKSMGMKSTIMNVVLGTEDDVIIVDAEREYGTLARAFGGEVVEISPHSAHHLNPLEVVFGFNDENLIAQKSGLITSILEQQMANGAI